MGRSDMWLISARLFGNGFEAVVAKKTKTMKKDKGKGKERACTLGREVGCPVIRSHRLAFSGGMACVHMPGFVCSFTVSSDKIPPIYKVPAAFFLFGKRDRYRWG